ncbi:hypothetical protein HDC91_001036 [Mucilaginibacter sp. AK015]|nr:hypothetical protein [Mucilaginibacter sp. AK015]
MLNLLRGIEHQEKCGQVKTKKVQQSFTRNS